MQDFQPDSKTFQKEPLDTKVVWACIIAAILVVFMIWPVLFIYAGVAGAAGVVVWNQAEKKRLFREKQAIVSAEANACAVQFIRSVNAQETVASVEARAIERRENLKIAGNPYWNVIPVVAYPYKALSFGVAQLAESFDTYEMRASAQHYRLNLEWAESPKCPPQLRALILSNVLPEVQQQQTQTI